MSRELQNLKTATRLFHDLTGGPTPQLCTYLLKMIDFLEPNSDLPTEINQLATQILLAVAEGVHERYPHERLRHSIAWSHDRLTDPDAFITLHRDIHLALTSLEEPACLSSPGRPSTPPATPGPPTNAAAE